MKRRVFNSAAAVSLVLCVAMVALWVRSYRHMDRFGREGVVSADLWQRGGSATSCFGLLGVEWWLRQYEPGLRSDPGWAHTSWLINSASPPMPAQAWHGFTFEARSWDNSRPTSDGRAPTPRMIYLHRATVPHWFVALVTFAPVALWVRAWVRSGHRRGNVCVACGYDLRATPDRCPECGAAAAVPLS